MSDAVVPVLVGMISGAIGGLLGTWLQTPLKYEYDLGMRTSCDYCGENFKEGQVYYVCDGDWICEECKEEK